MILSEMINMIKFFYKIIFKIFQEDLYKLFNEYNRKSKYKLIESIS